MHYTLLKSMPLALLLLMTVLAALAHAAEPAGASDGQITVWRRGEQPAVQGNAQNYTGSVRPVRIDEQWQTEAPARLAGATLTFEPGARTAWHDNPGGQKNESASLNKPIRYAHLKPDNTIRELLEYPAFSGFAHNLLPRGSDQRQADLTLRQTARMMPYHGNVDTGTVINALNALVDSAGAGNTVFYDFYTEHQKYDDPAKNATGLFFFRGRPGAPFALICPGGGFSYVGSFQEGFPYAMELSQKGYNAFVLKYRVGGGGMPATQDLAAALSYLFKNADYLKISHSGYSLWGSSAGARMAAYIGSHGAARFGGKQLPPPSAIIMAYTGHTEFTPGDPPTFAIVSADDPIVRISNVENRFAGMREAGIDVELRKYKNAGHGFGLGVGTDAEGWMEHAIRFWEKQLPADSRAGVTWPRKTSPP